MPLIDSPEAAKAAKLIKTIATARRERRLVHAFGKTRAEGNPVGPYNWQTMFFSASRNHRERCLQAANGVGKTGYVLTPEIAMHATGWYPQWWRGKKYTKPPEMVIGSETNELSRDVIQRYLLGPLGEWGTGWIPNDALVKKSISLRQCSVSQCIDSFSVKHASGGLSHITLKTYEQGRQKWQGLRRDIIALDEQPPADIWTEAMSRGLGRDWMMILTYTPLVGMDDVASHFMEGGDGVYIQSATWSDAPHLDEQTKKQMLAAYPEHERLSRSQGVPMQGQGSVYPIPDDHISCVPFEIPNYFKQIIGIDFGFDHPTAIVWLAYNPESDMVYITDCYRQKGETPNYHAQALKRHGEWIPVAWPHDGNKTDIGSGITIRDNYRAYGVNMLPYSARYQDNKAGSPRRDPIVQMIYERMRTGKLKVFQTCYEWFEEKRMYHRDLTNNGERMRIVAKKDDIMSATETAVMMLRHARHRASVEQPRPAMADGLTPFVA